MRQCKECKVEKELTDYYLKPSGKPKCSYCKDCYNIKYKTKSIYNKEYYENNKDIIKEKYKKWRM